MRRLLFPALLLLLIITQALGPSFTTIVFALMLAVIPGVTRVVRGTVTPATPAPRAASTRP